MVIKTVLSLEAEKNNNLFQFSIPAGASYDDIYSVLRDMRLEVLEMAKKAELKAKKAADELAEKEEVAKEEEASSE